MSDGRAKTVLITGASSGIGKSTALYLAQRGYTVVGTSRSAERLADVQAQAAESGHPITALELDINSDEAVARDLPPVIAKLGSLDALINSAAYGLWGPVESLTLSEVRDQFEVNFFTPLRMIKAVLPRMVRQGSGTVINISSVEGRLATPFNGAYASSKFALEGLSEAMRTELWPFGIRVVVVQPGLFKTNFQENQVVGKATDVPGSIYEPYLTRYRERHYRFERLSSDPIKVARAIHKILRKKKPAFRHPVGKEARLGMLGARLMPERAFQAMVSRSTIG